ncbi:DUF5060 domain-containing protein [Paenarthrobacter sp. NPDC091669]|uniref:DUF5060 domain-containing protein n=1 Tax=Paenarthrobacter sp. NPDC091669 TaxID=3364384 RepID=UPI0037FD76C6
MTRPWQTTEVSMLSARTYANPYRDVEPIITFTGPDGRRLDRPAFWDGDRTWRVRFAAPSIGDWSYAVEQLTGDPGLDACRGLIPVVDDPDDRAIFVHGFLEAAPNGRYLQYADGTPLLLARRYPLAVR